jgi:hypothetical protein
MTLTEIKKTLYKEKPDAIFYHCRKDARGLHLLYSCDLVGENQALIFFRVPMEDIEDGIFPNKMKAQLLSRYIVAPEKKCIMIEIYSFEDWDAMQEQDKELHWGSSDQDSKEVVQRVSPYKDAPRHIRTMFYAEYVHDRTNPNKQS